MRVKRNKVHIGKTPKNDEGFVKLAPEERVSFIWELTSELWSLKDPSHVERRLQRNVGNLIKK